jgi:uncharacterized RDD family membrane protein YckC
MVRVGFPPGRPDPRFGGHREDRGGYAVGPVSGMRWGHQRIMGMPRVDSTRAGLFDHVSALVLPNGTQLASVGRRIGSYFLALLLFIVTLDIGYLIWRAISWTKGQTPTQQILGLQTWEPQTRANATWVEQFLRELSRILYVIPFVGWIIAIVSFFMFVASREHRALHDQIGGTIVLYNPNRVLQPTAPRQAPPA